MFVIPTASEEKRRVLVFSTSFHPGRFNMLFISEDDPRPVGMKLQCSTGLESTHSALDPLE
jgi:hypothetical protein